VALYSNSQLIVNKILGEYEAKDDRIKKYLEELQRMRLEFEQTKICHIPRTQNHKVVALSKLAARGDLDKDRLIVVLEVSRASVNIKYVEQFQVTTANEQYLLIWNYLTRIPYTYIPSTRHYVH
jgi:Reverse transcriptase-like